MCFYTHHNIRRFDADNQIVITHLLNQGNLIQRTLNESFRCHAAIFLYQWLFQRTAVDADTNRHAILFCLVNHRLDPLSGTDISRIDTDFVRAALDRRDRETIVKMNIRHQWNMYLAFNLRQGSSRLHCRHCHTDNIAARVLQRQNLLDGRLHILCFRITHRLDQNRIAAADLTFSNLHHFRLVPVSHIVPPKPFFSDMKFPFFFERIFHAFELIELLQ